MKALLKSVISAFVVAGLSLALIQAEESKNTLEGKTFEVEIQEPGKKAYKDKLIFKDGKFESTECQQYGFGKAKFSEKSSKEGASFKAKTKSKKEGTLAWSGTLKGDQIEGEFTWKKKGKKTTSTFKGTEWKSLYTRLGGVYAIATVVDEFIEKLLVNDTLNANPAIDASRARVPKAGLKHRVTNMVCQATGGPQIYTGRNMKDSHAHLNISNKEWDAMVVDLVAVLDKHKVPEAEKTELLTILGSTKGDIVAAPKSN